jgi:AraC family transcriptional regulator, ethanolamine operon transcriptional activator
MPLLDLLTQSTALRINRFPDIDHFRRIERLSDAQSIPLDLRRFESAFAEVTLKSCSIFLQRTFPRILQARYRTTGAILAFGMNDADVAIVNGVEARPPMMLVVSGSALCDIVEPRANEIAFVNFDAIGNRGWPLIEDSAQLIRAHPGPFRALQAVTRDILLFAANNHEQFPGAAAAMEESILEAIDNIFSAGEWALTPWRTNLSGYVALVRRLDEFLAQNAENAVYSSDVARALGVSVRTVHNAVVAIRGMSLHRYCRLRRLWNVRRQLILGSDAVRIKVVASVNGFWHMGEFGRHYRAAFGETPQQTQRRRG